jgi:F-type H+-transporting ATPase subunit delta
MAENITAARPYARAAYRYAKEHDAVEAWSDMLAFMAAVVRDPQVRAMLDSPALTAERRAELLERLCADHVAPGGANFVRLLAEYRRLGIVPEIARLFEQLRADDEGVVQAEVVSAKRPRKADVERITAALRRHLGREVRVTTRVDGSLIGGAVVRAGDLVIDGSVRGRLKQLASALAR